MAVVIFQLMMDRFVTKRKRETEPTDESAVVSGEESGSRVSVCSYLLCNYMLIWYKLSHTVIAARLYSTMLC